MKIGVVGLGAMGQNHARVLAELGMLGFVCDVDPLKVEAAQAKYGVVGHNKLDLCLNTFFDGVVVATPTSTHLTIAKQCLMARMPVLIEKPISNNIDDARQIVDLAQASNKIMAVGYIERFNPAFQFLLGLVREGEFGDIISVNTKRVGGDPRTADNIVLDLMTHDFDLLMAIFGAAPTKLECYKHSNSDGSLVDSAQALLAFGSASATCEANWISKIKIREIHITGTKKCAIVDMIRQEFTELKSLSRNSKILEVHNFNVEPLKEELLSFVSDIKKGKCLQSVSGEDAIRALDITLKAAER